MDRHVNYTWVGSFVIVFIIILVWGAIWLSAFMGSKEYEHYKIYAKADISGLSVSSAVRFSGVKVGSVTQIEIDDRDTQAVIITIKVSEDTPITTSTVATVQTEGITGVQYVALKSLLATAPPLKAKPGQEVAAIPFQPSLFMRLSSAIQLITGQIEKLSISVQHILSEKNWIAVTDILANVDKVTANLASQSHRIDSIVRSTNVVMKNTAKASEQFPQMIANAKVAMDHVAKTAREVRKTTGKAYDVLNRADNIMQNASQQLLPQIQRFTATLDQVGNNVEAVTGEMKRNPSVLIRGRLPSRPGPGEARK